LSRLVHGVLLVAGLLAAGRFAAQEPARDAVVSPRERFGQAVGDDYFLVNYTETVAYWKELARQSDRMSIQAIGTTAEGRTMVMAVVTSPENQRRLPRYREIAERLARAEGLGEAEASALAREGKAVVWIDGGLHADEVVGAQQLIETVYDLASRNDAETLRFLEETIVLVCPANPDGMDLVSDWYMREKTPARRTFDGLPRLYQKYAGHDNNRDFYMSALAETRAINHVLYAEWFPQIVYDHHQSAPSGSVLFSPPFRDPFNYALDPLVITSLEEVGAAMHGRFVLEGKGGVGSRSVGEYSAWWNGGLRTSAYFHNMIGILTEIIGNPAPLTLPFAASAQLPRTDLPLPAAPQVWRFRQSIDYAVTANRAVLDYAARNRDKLLFGIYRMGRNAIERGSRDTWTVTPSKAEAAADYAALRAPAARDARGYVLPSDQPDFPTAAKFVDALMRSGVAVERATAEFDVGGKRYPAGSFVVRTAQAFRPHILDMFEPQDHPNDFELPAARPKPPYDIAGWTLALQMGVRFDRILDGFDGPFVRVEGDPKPVGAVSLVPQAAGYLLSHAANDAFVAVNRLVAGGEDMRWFGPDGTAFIASRAETLPKLRKIAADTGLRFEATASPPTGSAYKLRPVRIGLWERAGGSVAAGWTRLILENFEFPFTVVDTSSLSADLSGRFDVVILSGDGVPAAAVRSLGAFLEEGGTILAIGSSTAIASRLSLSTRLPIEKAPAERFADGRLEPLPDTRFYIPGSILAARVDPTNPIAWGLDDRIDLFFDESPAFRIVPGTREAARRVVWFDADKPLRSGWAWGQEHLKDAIAVVEVAAGKGRMVLYGPEILFRAQSHGAFKLLFNAIYLSSAEPRR
jgi:hypothetical protein